MKPLHDVLLPLGVSLHTLDPEQGIETIRMLAGSSVKSVEVWEPSFAKDAGFPEEARAALAEAGVAARSVHATFGGAVDISSPDPAVREAGMQQIAVALDLAVRLGAGMVVVHPSSEPVADVERSARMATAKASIEKVVEMIRDAGCRTAIEFLPRTSLGHSVPELLELLAGVDEEAAGVCLDTNHPMGSFVNLAEDVRALGRRLFALHCSDYDGVVEKHWPPLRGAIDWRAFIGALREIGFAGSFHYEAGLDGETPEEKLAFLEGNYREVMAGAG